MRHHEYGTGAVQHSQRDLMVRPHPPRLGLPLHACRMVEKAGDFSRLCCLRLGRNEKAMAAPASEWAAAAELVSPHSARQRRAQSATRRRRAYESCRGIVAVACRQSAAGRAGDSTMMAGGDGGGDAAAEGTRAAKRADMQWWRLPSDPCTDSRNARPMVQLAGK